MVQVTWSHMIAYNVRNRPKQKLLLTENTPLWNCYVIHICQIKKIVWQGLMTLSTLAISRMCHNWAWHFNFNMWNGERHLIIIVAWINNSVKNRIFIFSPFSPLTIFYHSIIDLWSSFMYSLSINWKNLDNC